MEWASGSGNRRLGVRSIDGCRARNDGTNDLPSAGGTAPVDPGMTAWDVTPHAWQRPTRNRVGLTYGGPVSEVLGIPRVGVRRLAAGVALVLLAGCGTPAPPSIAVGAGTDPESALLGHLYAAALRSYGSPSHVEPGPDPLADLDTGDVEVAPGFTGRLLVRFDPDATARDGKKVYSTMISTLPEGIAAGDYTESAQDTPALAVTDATAGAWDGRDLRDLVEHCRGLTVGAVAGVGVPSRVGSCALPATARFPDATTLFAALRAGRVTAAWTSTAAPDVPDAVVVLADKSSLIRAENVVPLYRRNVLDERQVLALNEVAGELDTGSLADMLRQVGSGADPGAVASAWLDAHPLGH